MYIILYSARYSAYCLQDNLKCGEFLSPDLLNYLAHSLLSAGLSES
jgi:hypothetical protein